MIFVTGGTGLLGSHILLTLSKQKRKFRALKRESSSLDICKSVFNYYLLGELFSKIEWIDGDINDIVSLEKAIEGCDYILHAAALVSFNATDFAKMRKINIEGTANVINVALDSKIKKLGYVSSIAALGRNSTKDIVNEESNFKFTKNESSYSVSKYYAEQEVWRGAAEGLDVLIINPSVILGPGNWNKGSSQMFKKMYNGLIFYTEGSTGFVDVLDVAESFVSLFFSDIKNERFIINSVNLSYREFFDKLAKSFGKPKPYLRANQLLKGLAWRFEWIKCFIFGGNPLITKETAASSGRSHQYSNEKVKEKIDFEFTDIDKTIKKYSQWFINDLD
tara:strand:+ start:5537 stop:6541 length:1005 start_codon:yes stop_codon:yes gene_type:complete